MILCLDNVLTKEDLKQLNEQLDDKDFVDGKTTAGWHARLVKHNTQLSSHSAEANGLKTLVKKALLQHPLFQMTARPNVIHSVLFSRYQVGMSYGRHVDNALMGTQPCRRSDISFTLFLNPPSDYEGGELITEQSDGERSFKLEAGSAVLYPSHTLHRVETVTKGVRLVAVGWIQSLVRDPWQREILFELDTVRRSLFQSDGKTTEFDLLSKCHANLLRQWAEL